MKKFTFILGVGALALVVYASCSNPVNNSGDWKAKADSLQAKLNQFEQNQQEINTYLTRFDSLDFDFYSHQQWDSLQLSHASNIVVTYPDGHQTTGIPTHISELKPMFVFAPDTRIVSHPIKFGSGKYTCVVGVMEGTFSQPMPGSGGKSIPPTGKKFKLQMCTVGEWKDGKMIAETLFWDNAALMKQIMP
ncbi:ester cyclase [Chitinophaga sp. HK235]|uniref:ester cyclase n=1 Tax=Chitinophaga sp. HK235 TaxID=2952571 RepID=UPI001BA8FB9E|nr:ester cyclase [Chitinophaga sp. HK235]